MIKKIFHFNNMVFIALCFIACSNQGPSNNSGYYAAQVCTPGGSAKPDAVNNKALPILGNENNTVSITVGCGYVNQPCASVTICAPGSNGKTSCQTIPNLLVDTGSYGLRIFDNATTSIGGTLNTTALTPVGSLYECVSYGDGTFQWGRVMKADVVLGSLVAGNVPIDIIEASPSTETPTVPQTCVYQQGSAGSADVSTPGTYNGILGVGLFGQDCGSACASNADNTQYFSCSGNNCVGSVASLATQVTNPVALMPAGYNNGVVVQLNNVSDSGAATSSGYMEIGIGNVSDNTPPNSVSTFQADSYGNILTVFGGQTYTTSFIDSGSNGLFFPNGCLVMDNSQFFIPGSLTGFTATQASSTGSNSTSVNFNVANVANSNLKVFNDLAADGAGYFDWGLPFFLGRTVYVGISGKTSPLGTGPYWAY